MAVILEDILVVSCAIENSIPHRNPFYRACKRLKSQCGRFLIYNCTHKTSWYTNALSMSCMPSLRINTVVYADCYISF